MRSLGKLEGRWLSSICRLEGYSRTMLEGRAADHQDLPALLHLLSAALSTDGCPEGIVSDHGAVFRAGDSGAMLKTCEIEPTYIELRKPWQNLMEAPCKVQRRLAAFPFARAQTCEESPTRHAAFGATFHTTWHWAHQERADHRRTPADVLGGVRGHPVEPEHLRRLFGQVQFLRPVPLSGFISIQRFYIYAEAGLARQRVSIWIAAGQRHSAYRETLLAQYRCAYDRR